MAVGIVVLASLLFAGAVQINTRNTDISSYIIGQNAVRLVERLRAVADSLDLGDVAGVRTGLAQAETAGAAGMIGPGAPSGRIGALRRAWADQPAVPDPKLVVSTREALQEAYLRVGTIAVTRGNAANGDGVLAEASLLALPVTSGEFRRLGGLIQLAEPGRGRSRFSRAALTALYAEARLAGNVALEPRWIATLPEPVRTQALASRAANDHFLGLLNTHIARRDVFAPLLDNQLIDAQRRAQREIVLIVGLIFAIVAVMALLSLQVMRSQLRSRRARAAFQHQALHDALTGLPNRRAFTQAAAQAVAAWTPVNDRTSWILSIDLDYFKEVNDRYGHQAGDAFLVAASQRLHGATPIGDLVARVGGDEFAVLVHHYDPDSSHAQSVGEGICEAFADPIVVEGVEHRLAASIGIVAVDALHETVDSLLRDADIAMYRAKEDGGDRAVMFDDVLRQEIVDRAEIAADLRAVLARDTGPRVVFQPILALDDRTCYGFEALVRWNHPTRGEIPAGLLIDIAQEARLIVPLGRRVVHEVCRHLAQWRADGLTLETLSVHINVSPMEAAHGATYASIADAMETWSIPAQTLVIELTETASMDSIDQAGQFLARLHDLGVRICLDDFGTGYSSLQHLNKFQVDVIKVDRSFVVSAAIDPAKIPIVAGIIALARGLNASVITEGIETIEQRELIDDLGCNLVQGYLFARPMPPEDAFRFAQRTIAPVARI
jgi:diguanylate cyclase (GGDEF)-like protein